MLYEKVSCQICGHTETRGVNRRTLADVEREANLDRISKILTDKELYKLVDELESKKEVI